MPKEVLDLLAGWETAPSPRVCECGALVPRAGAGEPCDDCKYDLMEDFLDAVCERCGGTGFTREPGHWADEMMGWQPCPEC